MSLSLKLELWIVSLLLLLKCTIKTGIVNLKQDIVISVIIQVFVSDIVKQWKLYLLCGHISESQSNHSSQSDSGVSEMTSSGHTRSQSVVSSIFSDAWRRGMQGEVWAHTDTPLYFTAIVICKLLPQKTCRVTDYIIHINWQFPFVFLPAQVEGPYASSFSYRRRQWRLDRKWCKRPGHSLAAVFKTPFVLMTGSELGSNQF